MARLRATVPDEPLHWAFHLSQPSPVKEERASFQACGKSSGTRWSRDSHVEDSLLGKRPFHSSVSKWRVTQPGYPSTPPPRSPRKEGSLLAHPEKPRCNCGQFAILPSHPHSCLYLQALVSLLKLCFHLKHPPCISYW